MTTYTIFYTDANGKSGAIEYSDYYEAQHDLEYMQKGIPFEYQDVYMTSSGEDDEYDDYDLYQDEEETWYNDDIVEEDLLNEDKESFDDYKNRLQSAKSQEELDKVWDVVKSSINQLDDKEANKLYSIYKSLKDKLNESLNNDEDYKYITKLKNSKINKNIYNLTMGRTKNDIMSVNELSRQLLKKLSLDDSDFIDVDIDDSSLQVCTDKRKVSLNELKKAFDEIMKSVTTINEDYFDDKEFITLPEEDQAQFEKLMNDNGWVLDDETTKRGSKNFYGAWFHKEGDGAQDIHYQFITKDTYTEDEWDELMDNTFDLLDECEKEYNTRIRFSAGLINDGSKYNGRGTIGIDIDAPELIVKGEDKVPAELAGHKIRLKNGKPHGEDSKKVIKDIEDHGFDVSQMGIKKDESLKENKTTYVWKKFPDSDDWGLFEKGQEPVDGKEIVCLSRMNRYFPWSVYVKNKEKKNALDKCNSDNIKDIKQFIIDNLDSIIGNKNESLNKDRKVTHEDEVSVWDNKRTIYDFYELGRIDGIKFNAKYYQMRRDKKVNEYYVNSSHPYDNSEYHWAYSDDGKNWELYIKSPGKLKKKITTQFMDFDTVAKELLKLDKEAGIKPRRAIESLKEARDYESEYNITPADKKRIIQWWKDVEDYFENHTNYRVNMNLDTIEQDNIDDWLIAIWDMLYDLKDEKKNSDVAKDLLRSGKALYNKYAPYSKFNYGVKESKHSNESLKESPTRPKRRN